MQTILITGGAGFIGSNFIPYFLENNSDCKVVNLDLLTYAGSLDNLADVENHPNYTFIKVENKNGYKVSGDDKGLLLSGLTLEQIQNIMADSTFDALKDNGRSVRMMGIPDISAERVVELMVKFMLEVLVVAELMEVDPYNQNAANI